MTNNVTMNAEDIIEEYFPQTNRRNLRKLVDQGLLWNKKRTGEEIDSSTSSITRYQKVMREMSPVERNILIKALADENIQYHKD